MAGAGKDAEAMNVAIVGGGIAGLSAAWTLAREGVGVTLIDRNEDLGGRCRTFEWQGRWVIRGAAAFISGESNLIRQAEALGIYEPDAIADATPQHSWDIVHRGGEIFTLPHFRVKDILLSPKIPTSEKIALGRIIPKLVSQIARNDPRDPTSAVDLDTENACAYFRHYSPAFVDYILEPIMQMFCGYGEDDYSLAWLLWLMSSTFGWSDNWWTFSHRGVGRLTHEMGRQLGAMPRCTIHSRAEATSIKTGAEGVEIVWKGANGSQTLKADAVVVAVPGVLVGRLMPGLDPARRAFLENVRYIGHHIVYAVLMSRDAGGDRRSLVLPTAEGYGILSNVNVDPLGDGRWHFYGEIKGDACANLRDRSDREIVEAALGDLKKCLPEFDDAEPAEFYLQRNDIGLCSRHAGFITALKNFRDLAPLPRVEFAGDYLINSTVGQSHYSGDVAARRLLERLP